MEPSGQTLPISANFCTLGVILVAGKRANMKFLHNKSEDGRQRQPRGIYNCVRTTPPFSLMFSCLLGCYSFCSSQPLPKIRVSTTPKSMSDTFSLIKSPSNASITTVSSFAFMAITTKENGSLALLEVRTVSNKQRMDKFNVIPGLGENESCICSLFEQRLQQRSHFPLLLETGHLCRLEKNTFVLVFRDFGYKTIRHTCHRLSKLRRVNKAVELEWSRWRWSAAIQGALLKLSTQNLAKVLLENKTVRNYSEHALLELRCRYNPMQQQHFLSPQADRELKPKVKDDGSSTTVCELTNRQKFRCQKFNSTETDPLGRKSRDKVIHGEKFAEVKYGLRRRTRRRTAKNKRRRYAMAFLPRSLSLHLLEPFPIHHTHSSSSGCYRNSAYIIVLQARLRRLPFPLSQSRANFRGSSSSRPQSLSLWKKKNSFTVAGDS